MRLQRLHHRLRQHRATIRVKLPGNVSKAKSGTHAELAHQAQAIERRVKSMLKEHRKQDTRGEQVAEARCAGLARAKALKTEAKAIRAFLQSNAKRQSGKGPERKSNLTDNQSAKMATGKGVIQGYTGAATVDAAHRIIVAAQAHGSGSEQSLLVPMIEQARPFATAKTVITADAGYHTEAMRRRIDSAAGRALYGRRIATVEPVFGNLRYNKRLDRFTLRGQRKVDTQWKLYCMVHNIEKLSHHGYAQ